MSGWLQALADLARDNAPAVLVTVVSARGSTPREAGCKMVVTERGQFDTIGGGNLEFTCAEAARAMLRGSGGPVLRDFPLGPVLGQCCGGHVSVLFEPMRPALTPVAIFGAGHVGRALVGVLGGLRLRARLIDSRADALAGVPSGVETRYAADPAGEVAEQAPGTIVLVMTHDHQLDFDIVAAALARADLGGVGLIGSETKRVRFVRRLARRGLTPEAIARLICPIGVPGAGGKLPAEIAIAVAAQILQLQRQMGSVTPMPAAAISATGDCGDCAAGCQHAVRAA